MPTPGRPTAGLKQQLLELGDGLAVGTALPSERRLSARFGSSRTTVRQALQELVVEGQLARVPGKTALVRAPKVDHRLALISWSDQTRDQGFHPASKLIELSHVPADEEAAERLGVAVGARLIKVARLRLSDGEPMGVEVSQLSATRFPDLRRALAKHVSLYRALEQTYGVQISQAEQTIETIVAPPREALLLHTEAGAPLLLLTRHTVDADGRPVEWVRSWFRGDRYRFTATLQAP